MTDRLAIVVPPDDPPYTVGLPIDPDTPAMGVLREHIDCRSVDVISRNVDLGGDRQAALDVWVDDEFLLVDHHVNRRVSRLLGQQVHGAAVIASVDAAGATVGLPRWMFDMVAGRVGLTR